VTVVAVAAVVLFFSKRRVPKEKSFRCARCSSTAQHSARTINAWREGKTKFFCGSCHAAWLKSQPTRPGRSTSRGERSGCLGVLACLVAFPVALLAIWWLHG
jgi:hypothetical protein